MKCINPIITKIGMFRCGKCLACTATKVDERLKRMNNETQNNIQTLFITLTYSDEFVPNNGVNQDDLRNYISKLKSKLTNLKYIGIGEYGGKNKRPHYHLIIWLKQKVKYKEELKNLWKYGITAITEVNDKQCNYIAKYHANKIVNEDIYTIRGSGFFYKRNEKLINDKMNVHNTLKNEIKCKPSFMIQSKGIGKRINESEELKFNINREKYTLRNNQGRQTQIPRYNIEKLTPKEQGKIKIEQLRKQLDEIYTPSINKDYINGIAQYGSINIYKLKKALEWEKKYEENVVEKKLHKSKLT